MRLVDADEANKYLYEHLDDLHMIAAQNAIDEMPTIDAQPVKHEKWSEYSRNALETYIECTNCCVASRPIHLQMVTRNGSGLPDYCPNCGAKMDGDTK